MDHKKPIRSSAAVPWRLIAQALLGVALAWLPGQAQAAPALTQNDVGLTLYVSPDGTSWTLLPSGGFFGAHRCRCPDRVSAPLQLTATAQANLTASNSTLTVDYFLGQNCLAAPSSCISLGSVTLSPTAMAPSFSSSQVFQSAAGSTTVDCGSLTAGSTTVWALLTQDGVPLSFAAAADLSVIATTVSAPLAVTALPANQGILVSWKPPADVSLVVGYQVLCLPRPTAAAVPGYETCGLVDATGSAALTPADPTQLCFAEVDAAKYSVRLSGLANGTAYTVAVVAIDPSGGVSPPSSPATATPEPTLGFYEKYKQDGGVASGCSLSPAQPSRRATALWLALAMALIVWCRRGRPILGRWGRRGPGTLAVLLVLGATARAQDAPVKENDDWAAVSKTPRAYAAPDWAFELGVSLYRPAIDSEFATGVRPYADTFSSSRHLMSEGEIVRYLGHGFGSWGVGLRTGYTKITAAAFGEDGVSRSGDETGLRLIPFSLSMVYRADGVPGLKEVPLIPYVKAGLDGVFWTASNTGSPSHTGFSPGWHAAAGAMIGLNHLGNGIIHPGALADPCAIFFEWDYAAINGLGISHALHVGDSTWFAGLMFDL
jgi:hypothetical protein